MKIPITQIEAEVKRVASKVLKYPFSLHSQDGNFVFRVKAENSEQVLGLSFIIMCHTEVPGEGYYRRKVGLPVMSFPNTDIIYERITKEYDKFQEFMFTKGVKESVQ